MDDSLALIPTIDDEGDVPDLDGFDDDEDDEEEAVAVRKTRAHKLAQATKGKSVDFNEQFQFLLVKLVSLLGWRHGSPHVLGGCR